VCQEFVEVLIGGSWGCETMLRTPDFVLWIRFTVTRRAVEVTPPLTVSANAARTASGTRQSLTGRLTSTARTLRFCDSIQPRDVNWQTDLKT